MEDEISKINLPFISADASNIDAIHTMSTEGHGLPIVNSSSTIIIVPDGEIRREIETFSE